METLRSFVLSFWTFFLVCVCVAVEVQRPRGVSLSRKAFYDATIEFTCLDGSSRIPFVYVNDDFCDCNDGSDEPGTPACPNGVFHCTNAGHKPLNIPSSRVNDGICDCCDASDEYNSSSQCVNNCRELGRKAREDALRQAEVVSQGYQIKTQLGKEGKLQIEERKQRLEQLLKEKEAADAVRTEKETLKMDVEVLEKAAIDKHKSDEEEKKKLEEVVAAAEQSKLDALEAFADLDANQDGKITYDEIQAKWVFDTNKDGDVTEEEAKFYLQNHDEYTQETFLTFGWAIMKPHYSMLKLFTADSEPTETSPTEPSVTEMPDSEAEEMQPKHEVEEVFDTEDNGEEEEEEDDASRASEAEGVPQEAEDENGSQPQYNEETQALVDAANKAREEFKDANNKVVELDREIRQTKDLLEIDFGEDQQFSPLYQQCVEYTDREYTYKLCLFDQVTQRSKNGGAETNLGRWGNWEGAEEDKYSKMKYTNGAGCWNAPSRSTEVRLSCGIETQLKWVSEPNRCVYVFELETPAICALPKRDETLGRHEPHEEL